MTEPAPIEFGLFDWMDASGRDTTTHYDERLALARRADEGGFARYHVAEHHGTPLGLVSSPAVWLAAVARETRRIRLVPTTFIVPFYDPLRLVEEIGMLDALSHGRLEVGIGKGSSPVEAAMFGFDRDTVAYFAQATGAAPRFGILRHTLVADTDREAFALAERAFAEHHASFTWLWRKAGTPGSDDTPDLRDLVERHLFFVGSPESVRDQVSHAVDVTGVNYLAGAFAWGGLPADAALRSLDLFDEHVIPALTCRAAAAR
ncbi:LLM class flavin-dependent oxidoreductase [Microbacterium paludicola]|uniref:LLM class flavin-dependent oxidoreductase n=1 Tax=Microbacterium paludicola TaxID=300019 RepID=UPI0031D089B7